MERGGVQLRSSSRLTWESLTASDPVGNRVGASEGESVSSDDGLADLTDVETERKLAAVESVCKKPRGSGTSQGR
ncbi:MAG: hypothetical protein PHH47_11575 [Gallionella sp.]|nr:hypothetical protein [Gallionella sp.]MDD4947389.1 hypothetical protein [Gallionella sp.]